MTAPAWENLSDFLQLRDFAVTATIALQGGGTLHPVGHFDEPYIDAKLGGYEADDSGPTFTCDLTTIPGVKRGDVISIPGEGNFDVMSYPHGDGTGLAMLELARRVEL